MSELTLGELREQLEIKLARNRTTATRYLDGEYKNPARKGYDIALTEVLALLGVDAADPALDRKTRVYDDAYYVVARTDAGEIRANNGNGLLLARPGDTIKDARIWLRNADTEHGRRLQRAVIELMEREEADRA